MRDAFYRLTSPILDRIPDISHQPKSREVSIGLAASIIFHLLLLLLALLVGWLLPGHSLLNFAKAKPKLQEIELTIIPPEPAPELQLARPAPDQQPFMDSTSLAAAERLDRVPLFQSDTDMRAASLNPARGLEPIPSQAGLKLPDVAIFAAEPMSLGGAPATPAPEPSPVAEPAPPETIDKPPKPTPLPEVVRPADHEIAFPKTAEKSTPPPPPRPQLRTSASTRDMPLPATTGATAKTDETRTQTDGNISDAGPEAVDAEATPYGRYMAIVRKSIKSRWNFYLEDKAGLTAPGSVRVDFTIDRDGRIRNVRSAENTANATYAVVCENAVRESELPPIPQVVLDTQLDERLDLTFRFYHVGRSKY